MDPRDDDQETRFDSPEEGEWNHHPLWLRSVLVILMSLGFLIGGTLVGVSILSGTGPSGFVFLLVAGILGLVGAIALQFSDRGGWRAVGRAYMLACLSVAALVAFVVQGCRHGGML
jgi:hypothetical protein